VGTNTVKEDREITDDRERRFAGPMSEAEVAFLQDMKGFIDYAIRNGLGFLRVLDVLTHDVNGIVIYHGMSVEQARAQGFMPKVSRGSWGGALESVGEPPEPAE